MSELHEMFQKQIELQQRLGNDINSQSFINIMTIAAIDELMEALRETPWKPWKKNQQLNQEKFKEEIIDIQHFIFNLAIASGMDAKEYHERFMNKNKENFKRQDNNY